MNEVEIKSSVASAMGAKVSVTGPSRGLYLIVGRSAAIENLVRSAVGSVILRLDGKKLLATLTFAGYLALRGDVEVSHIGPVSVDLKRLASVSQSLSKVAGQGRQGSG